jgi:hypothetical protein
MGRRVIMERTNEGQGTFIRIRAEKFNLEVRSLSSIWARFIMLAIVLVALVIVILLVRFAVGDPAIARRLVDLLAAAIK